MGLRKGFGFAAAALPALISVSLCVAQTPQNSSPQTQPRNDQKKTGIMVTVIDPQGAVVPGARVTVQEQGTKKRLRTTTTSSDGTALLSGFSPGSYQMEIKNEGFKTSRAMLSLAEDKMEQMTVRLVPDGKGTITLEMCDPAPMIDTGSAVVHVFSGDLLRAGSPR